MDEDKKLGMKTIDSRKKNSIRNVSTGILSKFVIMIFPILIRSLIVRQLGIEYAGFQTLFNSILQFLNLSELGVGTAIVVMMYQPAATNDYVAINKFLNFYKKAYKLIGIVILIVGLLLLPFLPQLIEGGYSADINIYALYLIYLSNTVVSYFLFAYRFSLYAAYQKTSVHDMVHTICYVTMSVIQIWALIQFKNIYVFAIFVPLGTVVKNLIIFYKSKLDFPEIKCEGEMPHKEAKDLMKRVFALTGHKIGGTIVGSIDNVCISAILGITAVGIYGGYYVIIQAAMGIVGVAVQGVLPSVGNYLVLHEKEKNYELFMNISFLFAWFVGACFVCLVVLFQPFMRLWLGEANMYPNVSVIFFCLYFYFWQFRSMQVNFKDAVGLWTQDVAKPYVASVVNIVLNIILIHKMGVIGALVATIVCMLFIYFPWEVYVLFKKIFERNPIEYLLFQLKTLVLWLVIAFVTYYVCGYIHFDGWIGLIVKGIGCVVVSNVLYLLLNFRSRGCKYAVNTIKELIGKHGGI